MIGRWTSFVEYVEMRQAGQTDAAYRNFDLLKFADIKTTRSAMKRAGFDMVEASRLDLQAVIQRLANVGITIDRATVDLYLKEWWTWDRLNQQEIRRRSYRRELGSQGRTIPEYTG